MIIQVTRRVTGKGRYFHQRLPVTAYQKIQYYVNDSKLLNDKDDESDT